MNTHDTVGCVFVVDDDEGMRTALELLIQSVGLDCVTFDRASAFLAHPPYYGPGCIISDVIMPEMTGVQLIDAAADQKNNLPIIMLTGHADVDVAVSAFRAGAFDFLQKPCSNNSLLESVQRAIAKSRFDLADDEGRRDAEERLKTLTEREKQVVNEMILGDSNKVIARKLNISHRTVERHRQNAMKKTGVHTAVELAQLVRHNIDPTQVSESIRARLYGRGDRED